MRGCRVGLPVVICGVVWGFGVWFIQSVFMCGFCCPKSGPIVIGSCVRWGSGRNAYGDLSVVKFKGVCTCGSCAIVGCGFPAVVVMV